MNALDNLITTTIYLLGLNILTLLVITAAPMAVETIILLTFVCVATSISVFVYEWSHPYECE